MIRSLTFVLSCFLVSSPVLAAPQEPALQDPAPAEATAEPAWVSDWEAAKAQAKKDGKDLFVDFTGSDWCGWCIRLHKEVFAHAEFSGPAAANFVFVELDFPRQKELSAEVKEQNQRLQSEFGVEGFPTIFLADSEGRPYGQTGYQPGGPEKYLAHVNELREVRVQRDASKAKADGSEGAERAKHLADAIEEIPEDLRAHYVAWMDEIIGLDADGKAGLKEKFTAAKSAIVAKAALGKLKSEINALAEKEDWGTAATKVEAFLASDGASLSGEAKMELCFIAGICRQQGGEKEKAIAHFETAIAIDPEHPMAARMKQVIEELKKGGEDAGAEGKKKG